MRNAALNTNAAQTFQDLIDRTTHMQKHGKIQIAGNLQLRNEKIFLARGIKTRDKEIEPDFTDSNRRLFAGRLIGQSVTQRGQVGFTGTFKEERMNPISRKTLGVADTTSIHSREISRFNRRDDDSRHSGYSRSIEHRITIVIELTSIQMAVGVDQHVRATCCAVLFQAP